MLQKTMQLKKINLEKLWQAIWLFII